MLSNLPDPNSPGETVKFHLPSLLAQARKLAEGKPQLRIVGLVADKDTPEAAFLLSKDKTVDAGPDESVSALLTRELARDILLNMTPQALEWFFEDRAGPHRMLPIIYSTRKATRTMSFSYNYPV